MRRSRQLVTASPIGDMTSGSLHSTEIYQTEGVATDSPPAISISGLKIAKQLKSITMSASANNGDFRSISRRYRNHISRHLDVNTDLADVKADLAKIGAPAVLRRGQHGRS